MVDFTNKYNTTLSPEDEIIFQREMSKRLSDLYDYDLRGAWKELRNGSMQPDDRNHLGDKYKKPNHPTFSDESIYNGIDGYYGGTWSELPSGLAYFASPQNMYNYKDLARYFNKNENGVDLIDIRSLLYR